MVGENTKAPEDSRTSNYSVCYNCHRPSAPGEPRLRRCGVCRKACYCNRECQKQHWRVHKSLCTANPSKQNPTPIIEPDGLENLDHVDFNCVKLISIPPRRSDGSPVDSDGITECILYAGMRDPIFEVPGFPCRVPWPTKPAHTLEKIEGIGWGMFAKRNIKAGELIYAERPLLLSKVAWDPSRKCDDPQQRMKVAKVEAEHKLGEALKRMTPDRREAFRKLQNCHSHEVDCPQLFGILRTNGSAANDALKECIPSLPNNEYGSFKVVGETCSRVNHSCRPNARDHFELQSFSLQLTAARDIRVGEEITIRYVNALESRAVRQAKLDAYYFICSCRACTNSTISDHRRQQLAAVEPIESVEAVVRWLNDRALPDDHLEKKALKLLGLLEEEGLESLEIYWFCKQTLGIVYAALGNERRALKYLKEVITQQEAHERYDGMSATEYQRHVSKLARDLVNSYWRLRCNMPGPVPHLSFRTVHL